MEDGHTAVDTEGSGIVPRRGAGGGVYITYTWSSKSMEEMGDALKSGLEAVLVVLLSLAQAVEGGGMPIRGELEGGEKENGGSRFILWV